MEADAGSLFVFFLFQPPGLVGQQFAESQIGLAQSVHLAGVDVISNKPEDVRTPLVPLRFVLTNVIRQKRFVFALLVGRPRLLVLPPLGAPQMVLDSLLQQRPSDPSVPNRTVSTIISKPSATRVASG
jgi:hypothetical protein